MKKSFDLNRYYMGNHVVENKYGVRCWLMKSFFLDWRAKKTGKAQPAPDGMQQHHRYQLRQEQQRQQKHQKIASELVWL